MKEFEIQAGTWDISVQGTISLARTMRPDGQNLEPPALPGPRKLTHLCFNDCAKPCLRNASDERLQPFSVLKEQGI